MKFPPRIATLLCCFWLSSLFGQSPTPSPTPVDSDADGIPDGQDGWSQHKQLRTPPAPNYQYIAIDLGEGTANAINSRGDVVGYREPNSGEFEAMLWRIGQPAVSLGFLTQDQTLLVRSSVAFGINDAGQVTGYSTYSWDPDVVGDYPNPPVYNTWDFHSATHAFLWQSGADKINRRRNWSLCDRAE
jgi:hypothetical protein